MADGCFTRSSAQDTKSDQKHLKRRKRPNIRNVTTILAGYNFIINVENDIPISMALNQSCYLIQMGILKDSLVLSNKLQDSLSWCFIYFLHLSSHLLYMHERSGLERLSREYVSILSCKTPLNQVGKDPDGKCLVEAAAPPNDHYDKSGFCLMSAR